MFYIFKGEFSKAILKLIIFISSVFAVSVIFTKPIFFTNYLLIYQSLILGCAVYAFIVVFNALKKKNRNRPTLKAAITHMPYAYSCAMAVSPDQCHSCSKDHPAAGVPSGARVGDRPTPGADRCRPHQNKRRSRPYTSAIAGTSFHSSSGSPRHVLLPAQQPSASGSVRNAGAGFQRPGARNRRVPWRR